MSSEVIPLTPKGREHMVKNFGEETADTYARADKPAVGSFFVNMLANQGTLKATRPSTQNANGTQTAEQTKKAKKAETAKSFTRGTPGTMNNGGLGADASPTVKRRTLLGR